MSDASSVPTAAAAAQSASPAPADSSASPAPSGADNVTATMPSSAGGAYEAVASPADVAADAGAALLNTSLYVGELNTSVTEAMLYELFSLIGPVASIRVCRDAITRRSLGYAYVNFHNQKDCERALETLNYTEIKGRPCRIMWSQRNPNLRKNGSSNVFIKNLDTSIDSKALHDTFAAFGNILSCKVSVNDRGESMGFGFVHYENRKDAEQAIESVNGMLLNGTKVFVGFHTPRSERLERLKEQRAKFTNVYIKNLEDEVDEDALSELFAKYGNITSTMVRRDDEGKSRGFGFINFEDHNAARQAVEELHDTDLNGKKLYVSRAQKKTERSQELRSQYEQAKQERLSKYQGVNVYVKNFGDEVDDDMLSHEFAPYGVITSTKVMRDDTGKSRGFGFVCYTSPEMANKAINEMNGRIVFEKPLYVALAQRREQRRQQVEATKRQWQGANTMGGQMYPGGGAPMYYPPGYAPRPVRWQGGQPPVPGQYPMPGQYQVPGQYPMPANAPRPARPRNPRQDGGRGGRGSHSARGGRGGYRNNPRTAQQSQQPGNVEGGAAADSTAAATATAATSGATEGGASIADSIAQPQEETTELTAAALAAAPAEEQKQMLGEALHPKITALDEERADKVTGMLLEMDNSELLHLLENADALKAKVKEAVGVLEEEGPEDAE